MSTCQICNNSQGNTHYVLKEMSLGMYEEFNYFQCGVCGCLQICNVPDHMERFYPDNYFSFRDFHRLVNAPWRKKFDEWRVRSALSQRASHTPWFNKVVKPLDYLEWMRLARLDLDARILDVGCGSGKLLLRMRLGGLKNCTGADLFINEDIHYSNGLTIHKVDFRDLAGPWDLIMFHHSLEHMADPKEVLRAAAAMLSRRGAILIRVPLADSLAWEKYGTNWGSLEAPRHFFLFTERSLEILTDGVNLEIFHRFRDATPSQFILSELYMKGIPRSGVKQFRASLGRKVLNEFERQTEILNKNGRGDCGGFLIRHAQGT
jgi:2-polyprenyl-3-methyl-5-hydroxy-6-metoxy-1,4-benzoquinol methylase